MLESAVRFDDSSIRIPIDSAVTRIHKCIANGWATATNIGSETIQPRAARVAYDEWVSSARQTLGFVLLDGRTIGSRLFKSSEAPYVGLAALDSPDLRYLSDLHESIRAGIERLHEILDWLESTRTQAVSIPDKVKAIYDIVQRRALRRSREPLINIDIV